MKQKKKMQIIGSVVAVLVVVVVLGIAYAGFTEQLNINGEGIVKSSTWKIKFANLKEAKLTGTAKEISKPSINSNDTKIGDYEVTLTSPGDSVSYSFEVVNEGTYDAKISSIYIPTPECTGSGDNAVNDAENVCNRLKYTLTYSDGVKIQEGDTLSSKETQKMRLTLTYGDRTSPEELAKSDVTVSNLSIALIYAQDGNAVEGSEGIQTYEAYSIGDTVEVAGENYYVIEDSGVHQDYVTLLKENPLTTNEVNTYGEGHINKAIQNTSHASGEAYDRNGYGAIAFYTSETCGYTTPGKWESLVDTGCTNDYDKSDIKYVVDAWAEDKLSSVELKEVNRYKARLITFEELRDNLGYDKANWHVSSYVVNKNSTPSWVYNSKYSYWTISQFEDKAYTIFCVGVWGLGYISVYDDYGSVRPVINVYKSSL